MDTYVYKRLCRACKGYISWKRIERRNRNSQKFIFFPEQDSEYCYWGTELLHEFMKCKNIEYVTLLFLKECKDKLPQSGECIKVEKVQRRTLENLMLFYALWDMSDKWIVVSTKIPYDTGAERLLGKKGVTVKDIVAYDVYQL